MLYDICYMIMIEPGCTETVVVVVFVSVFFFLFYVVLLVVVAASPSAHWLGRLPRQTA